MIITHTLHGAAIYAAPLTPKTPPPDRHIWQSHGVYGSWQVKNIGAPNLGVPGGHDRWSTMVPPVLTHCPMLKAGSLWHFKSPRFGDGMS